MNDYNNINHVAIYLRKSREEEGNDDVLLKHRETLTSYVKTKNWTYQLYEEVVSGESITKRKEMIKLLSDVEDDNYDGVVVMDFDRLTRGGSADVGMIENAFRMSETLIITPQRIYNYADDSDELSLNAMSFVSKMEYRQITKRMLRGKIAGAKQGKWVNGAPPFPYYYDSVTRSLKVNENLRPYYRMMVEQYIAGVNLIDICRLLSKEVTTPFGATEWSYFTIERILRNEVHLGYAIYGKTKIKKKVRELVPQEDWIKVKSTHEILKTEEEHEAIMKRILRDKRYKRRSSLNQLPMSSILYCQQCGRVMHIFEYEYKGEIKHRTRCSNSFDYKKNCNQQGMVFTEDFYDAIYNEVINIDVDTLNILKSHDDRLKQLQKSLLMKEKEIQKNKDALNKVFEMYEEGNINKELFLERKLKREKQLIEIANDLEFIKLETSNVKKTPSANEVMKQILAFKKSWHDLANNSERNEALLQIVEKIEYNRIGKIVTLKVHYR